MWSTGLCIYYLCTVIKSSGEKLKFEKIVLGIVDEV